VCVQTSRAFSADMAAEGLECALSATAEQSEPRTPFDWSDQLRTMREEETQVRWWAEDENDQKVDGDAEPAADYYCRPEATQRPPPSPIGDYAVVADAAPAPEEAAPAPEEEEPVPEEEAAPVRPKKVRVYFSGKRMWSGVAPSKRARRAAKKAPKPLL
jgi:hypothetical protein